MGFVTIAILPDSHVQALNREYRKKNKPTDVLSFPSADLAGPRRAGPVDPPAPGGPHLGDIAIARGIAQKQAKLLGHSVSTELRVLALHGLLHLLGYDHESDDGQMARAEARLRRRAGLPVGLIARNSR